MRYSEVVILIPSHSLEDFPTELDDSQAASLLNSFTVAWHPRFLAQVQAVPVWHRAEDPPAVCEGRLIFVPQPSKEHLPSGWIDRARDEGAVVIVDLDDRGEMLRLALEPVAAWEQEESALQIDENQSSPVSTTVSISSDPASDNDSQPDSVQGDTTAEATPSDELTDSHNSEQSDEYHYHHADDHDYYHDEYSHEHDHYDEYSHSRFSGSASTPISRGYYAELSEVSIPPLDELEQDCMALGTAWILMELLTRHMHHFSSYDEVFFEKTAVHAAKAWVAGNAELAFERLRSAFDLLTDARERFYPVDSYLLDLCLLEPDHADEKLDTLLNEPVPVNFLLKGADAEAIAEKRPEVIERMREAWSKDEIDLIGGDYQETPTPMLPLESTLFDFARGMRTFRRLFHREPTTWARRRYGLSQMTPQLLHKMGYLGALHVLLDDGIYPDREQSRMHWEGCDSSTIEAISRIPLAADSASSWLRYPQRMAEAMESDTVAALMLARWPDMRSPFLQDVRRIQKYSPVLGRFVTFNEFFASSDESGGAGYWGSDTKDYLSPFYLQAVARQEQDPISRFRQHFARYAQSNAAAWHDGISQALMGRPIDESAAMAVQEKLESGGPDAFEGYDANPVPLVESADSALEEYRTKSAAALERIIMHGAGGQSGWLVTNPLSFTRRVVVDLPGAAHTPAVDGPIKHVEFDQSHSPVCRALVEIPPAGFVWIPASGGKKQTTTPAPLAIDGRLQNEFFEATISEVTGGLQRFKAHGRQPNRLSQQLGFRFPNEQTIRERISEDKVRETKTFYSEMQCTSLSVTGNSNAMGEITTQGNLVDLSSNTIIAQFKQVFRVWRGRPVLDVETELDCKRQPEGDPWSNYYAARFAWNDSTAAISQSLHGAAQTIQMQRIESPDFIELATEDERTTIVTHGLPFHRKFGSRMIDSILVCEGEKQRQFRFSIAFDVPFPMQTAMNEMSPVEVIHTKTGPPKSGNMGWFYHLDSRCVQVTRILGLMQEPPENSTVQPPNFDPVRRTGFALRMQETEGRYQSVFLELFRTPTGGRVRDLRGQTLTELQPAGDGLRVDFSPYGIVDVEVFFD